MAQDTPKRLRTIVAGKSSGMLPAYLSAVKAALSLKRYDLIVTHTSPPLLFVPAVLRGALSDENVTILHHDLFPPNTEDKRH